MSDFRMYQVDDPVWDAFGYNGDRTVPYCRGAGQVNQFEGQCYPYKKARHDVRTSREGNLEMSESTENHIIQEICGINFASPFMEGDTEMLEYPLSDVTDYMLPMSFSDHNSPDLLGNGVDTGSSDLLHQGWLESPNSSNLDYLGIIFRSNDSTSGLGKNGHEDDLSWISCSSHAKGDNFKDNFNVDSQSSFVESSSCRASSTHKEANMPIWSDNSESTFDDNSCSLACNAFAQWLDANGVDRVDSAYESTNARGHYSKSLHQSEYENRNGRCGVSDSIRGQAAQHCNEKRLFSTISASEFSCYKIAGHQDCSLGGDLLNCLHPNVPYVEMKHNNHQCQTPTTLSKLAVKTVTGNKALPGKVSSQVFNQGCPGKKNMLAILPRHPPLAGEQKMGETHLGQWLHTKLSSALDKPFVNQTVFANQSLTEFKSQARNVSQLEEANMESSQDDIYNSFIQEDTKVYFWPENISLGPINFQQLQGAMGQLDKRTKLCLRDGLYRLAKGAEQRHNVDRIRGCRENMDASKFVGTVESNRCTELVYAETATNAIDRSIMNILFHKDSSSDDSTCLESHITEEELWPTTL